MRVSVSIEYPDACSSCGVPFEPEERRLGVLRVARHALPGAATELRQAVEALSFHLEHAPPPGTPGRLLGGPPPARREQATIFDPVAVSAVYREAVAAGEPPRLAVARRFAIASSTAAYWVQRTREAGLLPPTSPGRVAV